MEMPPPSPPSLDRHREKDLWRGGGGGRGAILNLDKNLASSSQLIQKRCSERTCDSQTQRAPVSNGATARVRVCVHNFLLH